MAKYRKKPVVVEAIQFNGRNSADIHEFCGDEEIDRIAFTAGASSDGNITITLNGVALNVAVANGDTATAVAGKVLEPVGEDYLEIITLEGRHIASPGDYIIKGVKGEIYPCKPDIFEKTYERVDE